MRWWGLLSTGRIGWAVTRRGRSSAPVMAESRVSEREGEAKREGEQGQEQQLGVLEKAEGTDSVAWATIVAPVCAQERPATRNRAGQWPCAPL